MMTLCSGKKKLKCSLILFLLQNKSKKNLKVLAMYVSFPSFFGIYSLQLSNFARRVIGKFLMKVIMMFVYM